MKKKEFVKGDKLLYIGKGFIGFDAKDKVMFFIERVFLFDYRVKYKTFEMVVRDSEVLRYKRMIKKNRL